MRIQQDAILGDIEIDTSEKDCIQLWQKQDDESNVIFIEREKLKELIAALSKQLEK